MSERSSSSGGSSGGSGSDTDGLSGLVKAHLGAPGLISVSAAECSGGSKGPSMERTYSSFTEVLYVREHSTRGALLAFIQGSATLNVPLHNLSTELLIAYRLCNSSLNAIPLELAPLVAAYSASHPQRPRSSSQPSNSALRTQHVEHESSGGLISNGQVSNGQQQVVLQQPPPLLCASGRPPPCDRRSGDVVVERTRLTALRAKIGSTSHLALLAAAFVLAAAAIGTISTCAWTLHRYRQYHVVFTG
uniref:Uncharacterized protein n=1 Tax=Haptolina brevifila TaxID=156173 RepID=A0A7S2H958_9EUKA|mmetsp:Transcript_52485/g.104302  ORF Transcript_52485/g.104302 Transcript_52485/m.104302 type:complete len:247 (+) Transcript_52485:194-934(+)